jgi:hypothetical protein
MAYDYTAIKSEHALGCIYQLNITRNYYLMKPQRYKESTLQNLYMAVEAGTVQALRWHRRHERKAR